MNFAPFGAESVMGLPAASRNRLQQLVEQLQAQGITPHGFGQEVPMSLSGGPRHQPGGGIHFFGPGGSGVADPMGGISEGLAPGGIHPAAPQDTLGNTDRPADLQHALGNDSQAAQMWLQHHPGALGGNGAIPSWVLSNLRPRVGQLPGGRGGAREALLRLMQDRLRRRSESGPQGPGAIVPPPGNRPIPGPGPVHY